MQRLLVLTFSLFLLIKVGFAAKQPSDARPASNSGNVPVSDDSAALAAKLAALNVPHTGDSANIPVGSRGNGNGGDDDRGAGNQGNRGNGDNNPINAHVVGNNGGCPDRPEDCGACRGWDPSSQCGASRACGKGYTCCETFCCFRQCVVPQDEVQNAHEDD